ncbi:MAG: FAD-binding oxidoreductase [Candidatus Thioglobus sp.]|nr:FAD-binding oxidoreductase [Candidatus Thioglobus sp.]
MPQNNLWEQSSKENIGFEPLQDSIVSDLAIIGGGYTGCSAALSAAESGLSVTLIDKKIGFGGSGRNVGLVNSGLWLPPKKVENMLGKEAGIKLNQSLSSAPDLVFNLIDKYNIDCNANRSGTLHCAHSRKGFKDIQNRYQQLTERGAELDLLGPEEAWKRIGSSKFHGALLNKKAGTINPLSYCQGLARAAKSRGAMIFESSLATQIDYKNKLWSIQTEDGSVQSKMLLIATNAYQQKINGTAASKYTPVYYFQAATKPLSKDSLEGILPNNEGCWDTATVMSSFRLDSDNRFIIGGIGNLGPNISKIHSAWAKRKMQSIFPSLENTSLDYFWGGQIAMTDDHIPKILCIGQNAYSIFGYSGRGIGPGTFFGKSIVETFLTGSEEPLPIKPTNNNNEMFGKLKGNFIEFGAKLNHLV